MRLLQRRLLAVAMIASSAAAAWLGQGCSPTAPQLFLPDTGLPAFDSALPPLVYDGGPEPVRVVVASLAGPVVGATVVFHDANGKFLASTPTDAEGHAEHLLTSGCGVSVLLGALPTLSVTTYLGVEPGDLLVAYDTSVLLPSNQVTIESLPSSPPPSAVEYNATTGRCQSGSFPNPPGFYLVDPPRCLSPLGQFPVLLEALDQLGLPIGFSFVKGQQLGLAVGAAVDMKSASWSTKSAVWNAGISNAPTAGSPQVAFSEVASFVALPSVTNVQVGPDAGAATQFTLHPGYADFVQTEVSVGTVGKVGSNFSVVATRSPAPAQDGTVTLDMAQLPPAINALTWDFTDLARPSATFQPDGPLTAPVGIFVVFNWTNNVDGGTSFNTWTIVAPPTMTTVKAPELPGSAAAWTPLNVTAVPTSPPTVTVMSGDGLTSYADFRRVAAAIPPPDYYNFFYNSSIAPLLPFDGTLTLTVVGQYLE